MEALLTKLSGLPHWQIAALATFFLLQGCVVAIFPEEVVITTMGVLWSQSRISFAEAMLAILIGLLPANALTVFAASRFGKLLMSKRPFSKMFSKESVDQSMLRVRRMGKVIVFFTRFTPIIRGPVYFASGLSQIGMWNFFKVDFLAALIQVPALMLVGAMIGKNSSSLMDAYRKIGIIMVALMAAGVTLKILTDRRRRRILKLREELKRDASEEWPSKPLHREQLPR